MSRSDLFFKKMPLAAEGRTDCSTLRMRESPARRSITVPYTLSEIVNEVS